MKGVFKSLFLTFGLARARVIENTHKGDLSSPPSLLSSSSSSSAPPSPSASPSSSWLSFLPLPFFATEKKDDDGIASSQQQHHHHPESSYYYHWQQEEQRYYPQPPHAEEYGQDDSLLESEKKAAKYFHEPWGSYSLAHYDKRYFQRELTYEQHAPELRRLVRSYLAATRALGVQTWLAHGSLLGWYWGGRALPWDIDIDVQVTMATLRDMADRLNGTMYAGEDPEDEEDEDEDEEEEEDEEEDDEGEDEDGEVKDGDEDKEVKEIKRGGGDNNDGDGDGDDVDGDDDHNSNDGKGETTGTESTGEIKSPHHQKRLDNYLNKDVDRRLQINRLKHYYATAKVAVQAEGAAAADDSNPTSSKISISEARPKFEEEAQVEEEQAARKEEKKTKKPTKKAKAARGGPYLLDVNPHYAAPKGNGQNIIDARWIDTATGLFVDITAVAPGRNADDWDPLGGAVWSCKNSKHRYWGRELWPLRATEFEGVPALIPYAFADMLRDEYGAASLARTSHAG